LPPFERRIHGDAWTDAILVHASHDTRNPPCNGNSKVLEKGHNGAKVFNGGIAVLGPSDIVGIDSPKELGEPDMEVDSTVFRVAKKGIRKCCVEL
jgi:hypothetical protein